MENQFEKLKSVLFDEGIDAIEDFLAYEIDPDEDKDVTDNRLDEAYQQMPEEELDKFYEKYDVKVNPSLEPPEPKKHSIEAAVNEIRKFNDTTGGKQFFDSDLKLYEEKFSDWVKQEGLSEETVCFIVQQWLNNNATEDLDFIKDCAANTFYSDAKKILWAVRDGEITEAAAVSIAKAEGKINDFVNRDYEEHCEEYEGNLPIWGDDWDLITDFLISSAKKGMDGESILSATDQWIEKGAYHYCFFEDDFKEQVPISTKIKDAVIRAAGSQSYSQTKTTEREL